MGSLLGLGSFGLFVTWLMSIVLAGMIGQRKGASLSCVLVAIVLGPLGIAFACAMVGARGECSYCRELVRYQARKCPHCHSALKVDPPAAVAASPSSDA